jgi:hypothetical protein
MSKTHSPNCLCGTCTSGDPYIAHIRNQFGKHADFKNTLNGGHQSGFNDYEGTRSHLWEDTQPWLGGATEPPETKANLKNILGDALGTAVGNIIQAKKDGQTLPKALDIVAQLGIKTEQAAYNAAQGKAATAVGQNVIKFSPYIIGGIVAFILLFFFVLGRKR